MGETSVKQLRLLVQGVDCPNCAAKVERAIRQVSGVETATLDFATSLLHLSIMGEVDPVLSAVRQVATQVEPDTILTSSDNHTYESTAPTNDEVESPPWTRLIIGAALYVAALLIPGQAPIWAYLPAYFVLGGRTLWHALRNIGRAQLFDENFLMALATVGAFVIGQYPEAVAVMFFYEVGELFQDMAVGHSRRSIKQLLDLRPDYANLITSNGTLERVRPEQVEPGYEIAVKPGERVPLDGEVLNGTSLLDTAALTGESVPRQVRPGDEVLAGYVNTSGALTVRVTKRFKETAMARVLTMVEEASARKAPTERFITRFARYYTPAVVIAAALLAVVPPLVTGQHNWYEWLYRALIFLVVSCPCALVVSVPLGFFGGIGGAARQGILVKGANYLEMLNRVHTVVFDKTGTVTKGVFRVVKIQPENGVSKEQLLANAVAAESLSVHPIAESIRREMGTTPENTSVADYREVAGEGIICMVNNREVAVGNSKLMNRLSIVISTESANGTVVHVAVAGQYQGYLSIADELKDDAVTAVQRLRACGVKRLVMLSGDRQSTAEAIASELGLDAVYAELLPDAKVAALERLTVPNGALVFVGDGINDAPVLARADVGVAMGALGSDAAIEAADMVLMTDEPSRLATAIQIARRTKTIVWQNIGLAFGVKGLMLAFGTVGQATMWEAVFADVGVALLAVLNSLRVMRVPVKQ